MKVLFIKSSLTPFSPCEDKRMRIQTRMLFDTAAWEVSVDGICEKFSCFSKPGKCELSQTLKPILMTDRVM